MARKFKKRLARKQIRPKTEPVLSISLIRKEYLEKLKTTWKKVLNRLKNFKLVN